MKTYILPSNWNSISCQMNHEVVTAWGNIFDTRALLETGLLEKVRTRETKRGVYNENWYNKGHILLEYLKNYLKGVNILHK